MVDAVLADWGLCPAESRSALNCMALGLGDAGADGGHVTALHGAQPVSHGHGQAGTAGSTSARPRTISRSMPTLLPSRRYVLHQFCGRD